MLDINQAALLVIDIQDKLLVKIPTAESLVAETVRAIKFARALDLPIFWAEQYPKGLGPTAEAIRVELEGLEPHAKTAFGCMGDSRCAETLRTMNRRQLLLVGIETHVCINQTALSALEQGYEVFVARDAVGSRHAAQHEAGLDRIRQAGGTLVTVEMALFEMLREAGTDAFKAVLPLLK